MVDLDERRRRRAPPEAVASVPEEDADDAPDAAPVDADDGCRASFASRVFASLKRARETRDDGAERFANEVVALLRSGVRLRDAIDRANVDASGLFETGFACALSAEEAQRLGAAVATPREVERPAPLPADAPGVNVPAPADSASRPRLVRSAKRAAAVSPPSSTATASRPSAPSTPVVHFLAPVAGPAMVVVPAPAAVQRAMAAVVKRNETQSAPVAPMQHESEMPNRGTINRVLEIVKDHGTIEREKLVSELGDVSRAAVFGCVRMAVKRGELVDVGDGSVSLPGGTTKGDKRAAPAHKPARARPLGKVQRIAAQAREAKRRRAPTDNVIAALEQRRDELQAKIDKINQTIELLSE